MKVNVGFWPLLFLIFLTLKLMGYITWSWWWVFAPLWGPLAVLGLIFLAVALVSGIAAIVLALTK